MRTVPAVSSNTSPAGSSGCWSRSTTATTTPQMPMHHRMVILVVPTPPVIPALVTAAHLLALHLLAPLAGFMGVHEPSIAAAKANQRWRVTRLDMGAGSTLGSGTVC